MGNLLEPAVASILEDSVAITAVISTNLHHHHLPQNPTYPAVTYHLITQTMGITHDKKIGPGWAQFQVGCWGATYKAARELAELVVVELTGYTGTKDGVKIQGCFLNNMVPVYDPDETVKTWQVAVLFNCYFTW